MVGVEIILLINNVVFSVILFVLLIMLGNKSSHTIEERVYLSKDMNKIKQQVIDSTDII